MAISGVMLRPCDNVRGKALPTMAAETPKKLEVHRICQAVLWHHQQLARCWHAICFDCAGLRSQGQAGKRRQWHVAEFRIPSHARPEAFAQVCGACSRM